MTKLSLNSRFIAGVVFLGLAGTAGGHGIRTPSNYGVTPESLDLCGSSLPLNGVIASCYEPTNGVQDFLFSFALENPSSSTSITSVMFSFPTGVTDFGLVEGTTDDPCSGLLNVPCLPDTSPVTISGDPVPFSAGDHTFLFQHFTGDLSGNVTVFFSVDDNTTPPTFLGATTTTSTNTVPEPTEVGFLAMLVGSLVAFRWRQAKQNR